MMLRSLLIFSSCLVLLNACTATPTEDYTPLPELTFAHLLQIPVQVREMDYVTETQRGAKPWDIADELPTAPDVAMRRYLEQRYRSVGANGVLEIDLQKADISHESVPQNNPFLKYVSFANEDEYTFEIIVDVAAKYLSGRPDKSTTLRFVRSERIAPHVTPAYREAKLQRVLEELIRDFDQAMINELAHDFDIIRDSDIPVKAIDVKTEEPVVDTVIIRQNAVE